VEDEAPLREPQAILAEIAELDAETKELLESIEGLIS